MLLMTVEWVGGQQKRRYMRLELERPMVYFLPLTWTIVHPIDDSSPLKGLSRGSLPKGRPSSWFSSPASMTLSARW